MKFRIGIVMAGAVSAGAYTAGVIDYLLEALQRWEDAKQKNRELGVGHPDYDRSLPMHDVVIDVMGGASAGGMTAAIATLGLFKGISPVTKRNPEEGANLIYDAWVNLNDDDSGTTIEKLLATDDLKGQKDKSVPSLLNAKGIWGIGDKAKDKLTGELSSWKSKLPEYISPEMEIILSLCSLRGIPVDMKFETEDLQIDPEEDWERLDNKKKEHRMYVHKWNAHFKLTDGDEKSVPDYTWKFDPRFEDNRSNFLSCAMASGAFPFGLRPIKVAQDPSEIKEEIITSPPVEYLRGQLSRLFHGNELVTPRLLGKDGFRSTIVDGGVVNNEPFVEVERVLRDGPIAQGDNAKGDSTNYALLMIDPFPSNNNPTEDQVFNYTHPLSVEKLLGPLFSAVRRQAMVKESDIPDLFSLNVTRGLIIPRNEHNKEFPIACGSLGGFGGFFSKEFREHDFFLGRKNCQSFLRKHFGIIERSIKEDSQMKEGVGVFHEYKECLDGKNDPMFVRFAHGSTEKKSYSENSAVMYPIIPDTYLRHASSKDKAYWDEKEKVDRAIIIPEEIRSPKISLSDLSKLKKPLRKRIDGVINAYLKRYLLRMPWFMKKSKFSIDNKTSDEEMKKIKMDLKESGIDFTSEISRNSSGEITDLSFQVSSDNDSKSFIHKSHISEDGPLDTVTIHVNHSNRTLQIIDEDKLKKMGSIAKIVQKLFTRENLWFILKFTVLFLIIHSVFVAANISWWKSEINWKDIYQEIEDGFFYDLIFGALQFIILTLLLLYLIKVLIVRGLTMGVFRQIVGDFFKRGLLDKEK